MDRVQVLVISCVMVAAAQGALSDFHMHEHTIGPVQEQYNGTRFPCKGLNASTCVAAAAAFCESLGWCHSFAVEDGAARGEDVQVYRADWNESLPGHPRWTLYASWRPQSRLRSIADRFCPTLALLRQSATMTRLLM